MEQRFEQTSRRITFKEIVVNNFIGGISWALGATVGLSLIVTLLTLIAKNVNLVPVVGSFVSSVIDFIFANNPHMRS